MSRRRLALALAVLAVAVAAGPVVAGAWRGGGERLLIGFDLHFTGPSTTAGTFQASGAVDDSGQSNVEDLKLVPFGHRDKARLSGRQMFTGAHGTIVTEFKGIGHDISQPHQYGTRRFRIVAGTGHYADVKGSGQFTIVVDRATGLLVGTEKGHAR